MQSSSSDNLNVEEQIENNRKQEETIFRARANPNLSEEARKELVFNEIVLISKDVDLKSVQTQCKSTWYYRINVLIAILVLASSAIIVGLQAASECINIAVITLASIIFFSQGANNLFKLSDQGVYYKEGTIRLRRIKGQVRDLKYMFHTFSVEQVLTMISQLRGQFDEIDLGLYKMSLPNQTNYNTGLTILPQNQTETNLRNTPDLSHENTPPHVHIHLDRELNNNSNPVTPVPIRKLTNPKSASSPAKLNTYDDIILTIDEDDKIENSNVI